MSDDKHPEPTGNGGGFLATIQAGLASLLSSAGHQPLKKISIGKPILFSHKTFLGSQLFLKDETSVEIEFNGDAQNAAAEAEAEVALLEAQGNAEADKIEAQGRADAERIEAEHRTSGGSARSKKK